MNEGTISREFTFEAGHRLMHHKGKCSNLHGHNYVAIVQISGEIDEETGMVMDFDELKTIVKPLIDQLDHAMLLNANDDSLIGFCVASDFKYVIYDNDPTAEVIASALFGEIDEALEDHFNIRIDNVTLYETPFSSATVEAD